MAFQVVVTDDAERDFEDFVTHKAKHDSPRSA
jgi:plasmid stabilization system protein ParE